MWLAWVIISAYHTNSGYYILWDTIPGWCNGWCNKLKLWHLPMSHSQTIASIKSQAQVNVSAMSEAQVKIYAMSQVLINASIYVTSPDYGIYLCHKPRVWHLLMLQAQSIAFVYVPDQAMSSAKTNQSTAAGYVIIPYYCICLCHKSRIWHLPKSQAWIWHLPMLQIQIILPAYMSQTQTIASAYVTSAGYDVFLSHGPRIFFCHITIQANAHAYVKIPG